MKYAFASLVLLCACDHTAGDEVPAVPTATTDPVDATSSLDPVVDVPSDVGLPIDAWDDAIAGALCELNARCRQDSPLGSGDILATLADPQACRDWAARGLQELTSIYAIPRDNPRVIYSPTKAAECLARVARSCDYPERIPACNEVFVGASPLDGPCLRNADCGSGAFCDSDGLHACGKCVARTPLGAPCNRDDECSLAQGPAKCFAPHDTDPTCVRFVESLVFAAGGECGRSFSDATFVQRRCVGDLACQDVGGVGRCTSAPSPFHAIQEVGAACDETHFCSPYVGLTCESAKCVAWGDRGLGAHCDPEFTTMSCDSGFRCGADRRCHSNGFGAPCELDFDCQSYACVGGACGANTCLTGALTP